MVSTSLLTDHCVIKLLGGDYSNLKLPHARGTLFARGPVAIRFNAENPEGVIVSFGLVGLRHQDGKHNIWTSSSSREFLKTLTDACRRGPI